MLDMLIQGGRVVTPAGVRDSDVGVVGEKIVSVFTTYLDKIAGRNVVDVRGGNIGIEIRMGVNYTEAVVSGSASVAASHTCSSAVWRRRSTGRPLRTGGADICEHRA